jgi:hypothetical protein
LCLVPASARTEHEARSFYFHSMDHGGRRRSGAGAAGGGQPPPPPPKVYRVEPRDFRELVQRLTGAGTPAAAAAATGPATLAAHQRVPVTPAMAAAPPAPGTAEQFDYAPWFSAPLLSPASYGAPGFGAAAGYPHHGSGGPLL